MRHVLKYTKMYTDGITWGFFSTENYILNFPDNESVK